MGSIKDDLQKQRPFVFFFDQTKEKTFTKDKSMNKEQKLDSKYRRREMDYSLFLSIARQH
jgi:hypothetical protein